MASQENPRKVRHISAAQSPAQASAQSPAPSESARRAADEAYARQLARERQAGGEPPGEDGHTVKKGKGKRGGGKKRRVWPWILLAVLAVIVAVGVKFAVDINNRAALFQQQPVTTPVPEDTPAQSQALASPTPSPTPDPEQVLLSQADLEFMKNRVNILVLGVDESTERENWGSFRTDTMILVTIDFDTNDVHMISIPRDSYVKICGSSGSPLKNDDGTYRMNKINSAFSAGGGAQKNGYLFSMNTVSNLFGGIPVNYYVGFNMNVVKEVVNAMGGVDYDVDVEINMNGRHLDTGFQHLDGQAVLDYCRQRKGDSDIKRVERQQKMLKAIFQQLKTTGQIANIPSIYQAVEQNVQTNLTFTQICSLAVLAMQMDFDQLNSSTVEGTGLTVGGSSCWGLYTSKLAKLIETVFGVSVRIDGEMDVSAIRERIAAQLAAIAGELNAANSAIATADGILTQYGDWLSADTGANLKAYRDTLEDLVSEADVANVESLVSYTNALNQLSSTILAQLAHYGEGGGIAQPEQPAQQEPEAPGAFDIPEVDPETGLPLE